MKTYVLEAMRLKLREVKSQLSPQAGFSNCWLFNFHYAPYTHAQIYKYIHTYINTYILACIHTHTYIHAYIHTYTYKYMHAYIHTYIPAYIQNSMVIFSLMLRPSE